MKKTPGKTVAAREKYWTKVIEEARSYPEGVTAYCRWAGVSKGNYYSWFRRLRVHHPDWHDLSNHPQLVSSRKTNNGSESDTEVALNARRRRKWSAADKERILKETDEAHPKELGAILRREGIYVHTLNKWRTERDLLDLSPKKRGPRSNPLTAENRKLKEQIKRLEKKLRQANEIIVLQKKISDMMGNLNQKDD